MCLCRCSQFKISFLLDARARCTQHSASFCDSISHEFQLSQRPEISYANWKPTKTYQSLFFFCFRQSSQCVGVRIARTTKRKLSSESNEGMSKWSNRHDDKASKMLNISPGKWACPNIWFEWRVSISTHNVRAKSKLMAMKWMWSCYFL